MQYPQAVRLVEVGPRDGLQNESVTLNADQKSTFVNLLSNAGLTRIETGAFVSPKWVPQMANSADVFASIHRAEGATYSALAPNVKGLEDAIVAQVDEIAVFIAVSESFSQKNLNASIEESFRRYEPVFSIAHRHNLPIRGYLSCVLGCPYEGFIAPEKVIAPARRLLDAGCYEVSLGDTIGTGTAKSMGDLLEWLVTSGVRIDQLAVHCHDTYGQALANILIALQMGVASIDCSAAGLGGCPFAVGATGNVATEDVICLLNGLGIYHGVNVNRLLKASNYICQQLNRQSQSRAGRAWQTQ